MKYFSSDTILDALKNSKIEDSFLALLCICKILDLRHQRDISQWMTFEKINLVRELVHYFDFETKKSKDGNGAGVISIILAKNFASAFGKINPIFLAAVCFRKYGIPDEISTTDSLVDYIKSEFCLTDEFCNEAFEKNGITLPIFAESFSNEEFEKMLKKQNNIETEDGFYAISCGPKSVIKNSAGNLGASYFQTLYSKMPSKVCLITEFPNEYPCFENEISEEKEFVENSKAIFTPAQIIYYGVPGCGKSNKITNLLEAAKLNGEITNEELQVERVVFHPEYTNADFVGQVRPVVKPGEGVNYDFVAGPFTRILARAYANPTKPYYLIIEEINRGNAAAIFGEIFQLLDRHKKGESDSVGGNTYPAGWSKYFVDHEDVNGIVRKEISKTSYEKDADKPTIKFTENTAIRLPPNLSIYATMNTSDQNVFTLDNAFKRRFDFELVKNSLEGEEHKVQRETKIEDTNITWGTFWKCVNELILENHSAMTSFEDKRLGAYFIVGEDKGDGDDACREISKKLFAEKVLEYLWDDVFKYKRRDVFQDDCKSIEQVIEKFTAGGFSDVFKNLEFPKSANER